MFKTLRRRENFSKLAQLLQSSIINLQSKIIKMGSKSKRHGLTGVTHRQPKSNVAKRTRKARLNKAKKAGLAEVRDALKKTPEVT